MKVVNTTRKTVLAEKVITAGNIWQRMKGLLGREDLPQGEGLLLPSCKAVHMCFMRFAIDVVFVNNKNKVVGVVENIRPFRLSPFFVRADSALELPAGTACTTGTRPGDTLVFTSGDQMRS